MKKHLKLLTLLVLAVTAVSCSWDLDPQPTVTVDKIQDIQNGAGKIILRFNPAVKQNVILKTNISYTTSIEHSYNTQLEIPAWTDEATVNLDVLYIPKTDTGMEITFKLLKVYGDCAIGSPSEVTLVITD